MLDYRYITHASQERPRAHHRYITHACGLHRYITHVFLWNDTLYHPRPYRYIAHANRPETQHWRGFLNP